MILNQQQIEEIEARISHRGQHVPSLIATVKHLQSKEQKSRELLEECASALQNQEYPPWAFIKKIEEHLK